MRFSRRRRVPVVPGERQLEVHLAVPVDRDISAVLDEVDPDPHLLQGPLGYGAPGDSLP